MHRTVHSKVHKAVHRAVHGKAQCVEGAPPTSDEEDEAERVGGRNDTELVRQEVEGGLGEVGRQDGFERRDGHDVSQLAEECDRRGENS